jgi:hypothetical protein
MPILFALTIFAAAALLFLLEPMVGKMLLPTFGGAPAVWNVCLAFFQAVLLAAYAYAHWLTRAASIRVQLAVHSAVVALPWVVLPLAESQYWAPRGGSDPTWSLLIMLATTVGLPFFVVAATSPVLSQWFAATGHRRAADPYYLYAASNAGSLLGLLAYPLLVEPRLDLSDQNVGWAAGYAAFAVLLASCMAAIWRNRRTPPSGVAVREKTTATHPSTMLRLTWIALAFVPSSLLLGVTATLSIDVSPVPLIWVVPLALYLLSFVLVFSRLPAWMLRMFAVALPLFVLAQIYVAFTGLTGKHYSMPYLASLHLATFFSAAMVCHGELARRRPDAAHLTEFYFCLSLGGVLGGLFNALAAPLLFDSLMEYPLAMSAACLFSPLVLWRWPKGRGWLDLPIAVVVALLCAVVLFQSHGQNRDGAMLVATTLCLLTLGRPVCFALSAAALLLMVGQYYDVVEQVQLRQRDFYGVLRVKQDPQFRYLLHGRILHGKQRRDSEPAAPNVPLFDQGNTGRTSTPGVRHVPLLYYYPSGPIGQVFRAPLPALQNKSPVALVGLGVGSLAYYGRPRQEFTFYEIDPAVERIASNEEYFTFLRDSRAEVRVVLGDARLSLHQAPNGHYALIVIDAFSGDAIPVHLLTHEAMQLYLAKLAPDGVLAFHISNNFLDLAPVLGNLASASQLVGLDQNDAAISEEEQAAGKSASHWVVLARQEDDFGPLTADERWRPLAAAPEVPLWTDHYTSLWGVARWSE